MPGFLHSVFRLYLRYSFHVAFMVLCFFEITLMDWGVNSSNYLRLFVFLSSILAYNGIKFYPHFQMHSVVKKLLILIGFTCFVLFFYLHFWHQFFVVLSFILSFFYVVPLPYTQTSFRNRFGFKLFIVALCWALITVVLPLANQDVFSLEKGVYFGLRLLLVFVATLPFEINDLSKDHRQLGTIPQRLGVSKTIQIGTAILVGILFCHGLVLGVAHGFFSLLLMGLFYALSLFLLRKKRLAYFTLFWVEAIPVLGVISSFFLNR